MTLNEKDSMTVSVHAQSDLFRMLGGAVGAETGEEWREWSPTAQNKTRGKKR